MVRPHSSNLFLGCGCMGVGVVVGGGGGPVGCLAACAIIPLVSTDSTPRLRPLPTSACFPVPTPITPPTLLSRRPTGSVRGARARGSGSSAGWPILCRNRRRPRYNVWSTAAASHRALRPRGCVRTGAHPAPSTPCFSCCTREHPYVDAQPPFGQERVGCVDK